MGLSNNGSSLKGEMLTSLTYSSRASEPMSVSQLRDLEGAAQMRNRAEGLTGRAIYDDGRFFQWLEGPADALGRVWDSVRRDRRHTNIQDVSIAAAPERVFGEWDMVFDVRPAAPQVEDQGAAPTLSLVAALDPILPAAAALPVEWGREGARPVIPVLRVLSEGLVLPRLLAKHGTVRRFLPPVSPAAARLSSLLVAADPGPAFAMLRRLYARAGALAPLCATVLEPAARRLGDLRLTDDCSDLTLTLGLCRLQSAVRTLTAGATRASSRLPAILIAAQPGEQHQVGASLDAELLWQAGWDAHREFPATDQELNVVVAETWFDVLDLVLSPALSREDSLSRMADTIAGARAASRNPALTVITSGRAFSEGQEAQATVGADASTTSALHIVLTAKGALQVTLSKLAEVTALVTNS